MIQRSRIPLLTALVAAMVLLIGPPALSQAAPRYLPGELIIRYKAKTNASERAALRGQMRAELMRDFHFLDLEHVKLRDMTVEEAVAKFKKHPGVEYVQPNYVYTADVIPNDTRFGELWGMRNTGQTGGTAGADIKAYLAWEQFTGDPNLKIGIIDTGVDYNHPDLAANIWTNPGEIPGNGNDDDGNGYIDDVHGYDVVNGDGDPFDDNGHGTHCAGTIAGVGNNNLGVTGVNWGAKIVAIKFLDSGGYGSTAGAITGIRYAIRVGVRLTSNSWGGGAFDQGLLDAINDAGAAGQLFVAAAGNNAQNTDTSPHYPSSYDTPYILSVGASDHNDAMAYFSNYGATTVDLFAPGVDILSCQPGGGYQLLSGTSMAAPHASGTVALAMGRFPAMTALQVKQLVMNAVDPKSAFTGKCVTGGRLNAFMTIAEPDSIPPGQITNLATVNPGSNTMGLTWTATGDDGSTGRASRYEIRYSTSPIDNTNWASATPVTGPDPLPAGSPQSFEVPGLAFSTTYYFAIKAFDEFGNAGPLSNVPMGTTLGIPDIAAAPASFTSTLLTGAVETQTLTLTNAGQGTLDFTVPVPELLFSQPVLYPYEPVPKGGGDVRVGEPVLDNKGGPDGYGYRWMDSNEPGGPTFDWVDITGVGTPVALTGDDAISAPIAMGMDFPFYENSFNSLRVCTNGFLSFTDASTAYSNQGLPNTGAPANLVAPLWDDLDFGTGTQRAYTYFDGTRFIVSWVGVPHYSTGGPYTFQAILYPTGEIRYQYLSVAEPTNSLTIGIQNAARDIGLTVAYNAEYVADNLAIRIYPLSQWLTVTPTSGRINAGLSQDLQVRFNALGMMGGTYEGNVRILSNDPDGSPLVLPATLHVTGAPDVAVNPASLDFDTPFAGATLTRTLTVSNPGTDNLVVSNVTTTDASVTVDLTSFTLAPKAARNLTVTWHPTAPMTLNALVQIASNDPDTPVKDVPVTGQAVPAPNFSVTPEALAVTLLTNTATSRTLRVSNTGGSNYVFTAEPIVLTPSGTVTVHGDADNVELEKGAPDVQSGPEPLRAGGPDVYGYTYQDSDESGGPSFGWVDVRPVATQINMTGDDSNTGPYPIGFDFPFYGKTFNSFRICTNGFVSFTSTLTTYTNTTLPNTGSTVPANLLSVFWDDLNFSTTKRAYYYNDGTKLVIQYQDVVRYGETPTNTFEILLYPNGTIVYQYLSMATATKNSCTIGIQNEAKNDGLQVVYNANYLKNALAIRFRPPARFLTVSPNGGTVPAGGFLDLNVGFNAAGMFGGLYNGIVRIKGNDPVLPQKDVPADLTVIGVPDISVTPAALAYGDVFIGYPHILQVTVRNLGTDVLHVTSITSSDPAYGVNPTSLNVPTLGSALVDVSFNPTSVSSFPATLTLNSDDPDTPAATVALSGNGIVAPDIGVSPASIATTLNIPGTDVKTLTISNTGGSDLNFTVGTLITALSVPVYEYQGAEPGKDEPDTRPGILGSGGPDVFGYTWRDSDEPGGPLFDWVDITGIGTPLALNGDDQNLAGVPVGFDFPFYGNTFNTVNVCSNGWLSFTNTTASLTNYALPSSSAPENLLAAFWDDLDMRPASGTGRAYVFRDGTRFILSYVTVPRYSTLESYTFQVILYPSGRIVYQYLSMQPGRLNEATIGIQNAAMNDGLTVVYNASYAHDSLAVELATIPDYLTVSPSMGTIPAGGTLDLAVNFNTAGMFGGVYNGQLRVSSNDPDEGLVTVPTTLTAIGTPDIAAVPASLDFGWQYVSLYRDLTVEVRNVGSDVLTITGGSTDGPNYSLVGATFPITLGNRAKTTLTVRFAPTGACNPCAGNLLLASNDPDTPTLAVPLTGIGVTPPEIDVAPTSLHAALATTLGPTALTAEKRLFICNTGGSDLTWTAEALSMLPASVNVEMTETGKDDPGSPGEPTAEAHGGPDAFGYRWADNEDPYCPAFHWEDITAVGTPIPFTGDDQNQGPFPLPFPFTFYGNTFNSFQVCSNGWVSFTSTATTYTNYPLPSTSAPENLLAPFWDDLTFSSSGDAYYHYDGTKFIISYVAVPRLGSGGPYTFQILLYPSGTVDYQYLDMQGTRLNEATIGIQNAAKDVGLTVVYNAAYVKNNLRVRFASQPGWLTVNRASGVTPAGKCDTLLVKFDATGLVDGDYGGEVRIASNDLDEPMTLVPCDLHVGVATAAFDLDPNTLNRSSNGNWVQGKVTPPAGNPPQSIRTSSVLVQRAVPVAPGAPITYTGPQAYYKFSRPALQAILPVGDAVPVEVIGEVTDVTWFAAWDTIRVLKPKMTASTAPSSYGSNPSRPDQFNAGSTIQLAWQDPEGYPASSYELWYSEDAGESWTLLEDEITAREYTWAVPVTATESAMLDLVALDDQGIMGSWLSNVFYILSGATAVDDGTLPDRFGLRFAGANPAAQSRLELALPERGRVEVRVHDVRGAVVRELANGELEAGLHSLRWDGADGAGRRAQPGMYFIRAKAGGHDATLRFVLVR